MFDDHKDHKKYVENSNIKSKKQIMIGDQVFSESQKKKPILNQITENSDITLTPLTKGKESFKSSIIS